MKRLLLFCLTLIIITTSTMAFALPASAETYSGTCGAEGDNLTWTLETETGVLTISGSGRMKNYSYDAFAPWYDYRDIIRTVVIKDGVTSIGDYAFNCCASLVSITIPEGVTNIGILGFYYCSSLMSVTLPEGLTSIGGSAFSGCSNLTIIVLPVSMISIGGSAFRGCSSLMSIAIPDNVTNIGGNAFLGCEALETVYNCSSLRITRGSSGFGYIAYYAEKVNTHFKGAEATCASPQVCRVCATVLEPALAHNVVTIASTSPTCVDSGLTGREQCTVCEGIVVAGEVIAPLGHAFALITSKGIQCSRCSVVMPYDVALFGVRAILIASAGVVVLLAIIVIIVASKKRSKKKNIIIRTTELEHLESKTRR